MDRDVDVPVAALPAFVVVVHLRFAGYFGAADVAALWQEVGGFAALEALKLAQLSRRPDARAVYLRCPELPWEAVPGQPVSGLLGSGVT